MANSYIYATIRAVLLNYNDITDIVGDRIYGITRPQALPYMPFIAITKVGQTPNNTKYHNSTVDNVMVQIAVVGNYDQIILVADVVRDALDNYIGTPNNDYSYIQESVFQNQADTAELDYMKADTLVFDGVQTITQTYMMRMATGY